MAYNTIDNKCNQSNGGNDMTARNSYVPICCCYCCLNNDYGCGQVMVISIVSTTKKKCTTSAGHRNFISEPANCDYGIINKNNGTSYILIHCICVVGELQMMIIERLYWKV